MVDAVLQLFLPYPVLKTPLDLVLVSRVRVDDVPFHVRALFVDMSGGSLFLAGILRGRNLSGVDRGGLRLFRLLFLDRGFSFGHRLLLRRRRLLACVLGGLGWFLWSRIRRLLFYGLGLSVGRFLRNRVRLPALSGSAACGSSGCEEGCRASSETGSVTCGCCSETCSEAVSEGSTGCSASLFSACFSMSSCVIIVSLLS